MRIILTKAETIKVASAVTSAEALLESADPNWAEKFRCATGGFNAATAEDFLRVWATNKTKDPVVYHQTQNTVVVTIPESIALKMLTLLIGVAFQAGHVVVGMIKALRPIAQGLLKLASVWDKPAQEFGSLWSEWVKKTDQIN